MNASELAAVREGVTKEQAEAVLACAENVSAAVEKLARVIEGTPLQHVEPWHGYSIYALLLRGAFGVKGLAETAVEELS